MVHLTFTVPSQTGGLNAGILYFHKFMFVFVRLKVCCHNYAVGVRIAGHGKAQGRTAGGRPQRRRPPGKLPACIGYGFHGGAGAALFHFLAGGTADAGRRCGHNSTGTLAPRTAIGSEEINPSGTPSGSGMAAVLSGRRSCVT